MGYAQRENVVPPQQNHTSYILIHALMSFICLFVASQLDYRLKRVAIVYHQLYTHNVFPV